MKKVILIIALTSACFISANAQKAVYDQNNNMTGIYDIIDTEDLFPCSKEKFVGRLISVLGEYPEHQIIIQTTKGKENMELNTATMSMVDRSNLGQTHHF